MPLVRAGMFLETNHPQWLGVRVAWRPGLTEADLQTIEYGARESEGYRQSPARLIREGGSEVRGRLDRTDAADDPFRSSTNCGGKA